MSGLGLDPRFAPCTLHKTHSPTLWRTVQHHVVPESWTEQAGEPHADTVVICDTAHYGIHEVIDDTVAGRTVKQRTPASYLAIVQKAIDWWTAHGQPPVPRTLEHV